MLTYGQQHGPRGTVQIVVTSSGVAQRVDADGRVEQETAVADAVFHDLLALSVRLDLWQRVELQAARPGECLASATIQCGLEWCFSTNEWVSDLEGNQRIIVWKNAIEGLF